MPTSTTAAAARPVATGVLRFNVDTRHLTSSAWASMLAATPGTQLGTVTNNLTGTSSLRVLSHGTDASRPVRPRRHRRARQHRLDHRRRQPRLRDPPDALACAPDVRARPAARHRQAGRARRRRDAPDDDARLRSSIVYGGKSRGITLNPTRVTATDQLRDRPACADAPCTTLTATNSTASATVHLPKTVTLAAPVNAVYGYRQSIGGTGRSGDVVNLQSLANTSLPARGSTMVRPDGTFVIRATLRSIFSDDGDPIMPARGRYAVASVEGGNATVYGIAAQDTHVVLSQPRFVLQRKAGSKLHFSVRIPGADSHVRIAIKLGSQTLATGYSSVERHVREDDRQARTARATSAWSPRCPAPTPRSRRPRRSASSLETSTRSQGRLHGVHIKGSDPFICTARAGGPSCVRERRARSAGVLPV